MKVWTVQRKRIVNEIIKGEIYYPDVEKSNYNFEMTELRKVYKYILGCFNKNNETNYKGIGFVFYGYDSKDGVKPFENIEQFKEKLNENRRNLRSLWKTLISKDSVILELEYEDDFNPHIIDLNDFQAIMPPIIKFQSYGGDVIPNIIKTLRKGEFPKSTLPSNIIQGHVPFISKKNIKNIYPVFKLKEVPIDTFINDITRSWQIQNWF